MGALTEIKIMIVNIGANANTQKNKVVLFTAVDKLDVMALHQKRLFTNQ